MLRTALKKKHTKVFRRLYIFTISNTSDIHRSIHLIFLMDNYSATSTVE
jgi:hypothetical protein